MVLPTLSGIKKVVCLLSLLQAKRGCLFPKQPKIANYYRGIMSTLTGYGDYGGL